MRELGDGFGRLEFHAIFDRLGRLYHTDDPIIDSAGCIGPFRIEGTSRECRFSGFLLIIRELSACRFNVHNSRIEPIRAMSSTAAYGDPLVLV